MYAYSNYELVSLHVEMKAQASSYDEAHKGTCNHAVLDTIALNEQADDGIVHHENIS